MFNRKRVWKWIGISVLSAAVVLFIVGNVMLHRAGPILQGRIIETLRTRFNSRVELDKLDVSIGRGLEVVGEGLRIFPPEEVLAAGANHPLIALRNFNFHSGVLGLFLQPMHVAAVKVSGLDIHIPPREMRQQAPKRPRKQHGKLKIAVDEIICDNSRLVIGTAKPDKEPKTFVLRQIEMHDIGPNAPWRYDATLSNAVPRGDIVATGLFGPWQTESPGDSTVTGHYTFDHADLNTIKGIGGMLSSVGEFKGQLDRIVANGTTETPDFSLDTAHYPVPLHTRFEVIIDGTSGNTYLQSVEAKLGGSNLTARGAVLSIKGKGHRVQLDVDILGGQIQDFLNLAVKTQPPVITGTINTKTKLIIEPGEESVTQKLQSAGSFQLWDIHFTNPEVQDKVDELSLRARGEPERAKSGAKDVNSRMTGDFSIGRGQIQFSRLTYVLPGGRVNLAGVYSMDGQKFEFRGNVLTNASLREMVASRWKSWLLTPISYFFKKEGGGADIGVKISGTKSKPKFGLDLHLPGHSDKDKPQTPDSK